MIGFNALGRMGRLCNQMFQFAALRGLSSKIGAEICIPYYQQAVDDGIGNMLRTELFDSFNLKVKKGFVVYNVSTAEIGSNNASDIKDMGKIMGIAAKKFSILYLGTFNRSILNK